jgi:anti-anti-sigma factor
LPAVNYVSFRLTSAQMKDGVSVVSLRGDLDFEQTPKVDHELETLQNRGARHLILDLLDVPFLDSSVLGVLLKHSQRIRSSRGTLTLVIDNNATTRGIERYLDGHFRIASTLSEAVNNLAVAAS